MCRKKVFVCYFMLMKLLEVMIFYIDVVRHHHPDQDGPYSWWSWRGQAFANDSGWRIDYHLATPKLAASATRATSLREADYESRISDHCPVVVDYDLTRLS